MKIWVMKSLDSIIYCRVIPVLLPLRQSGQVDVSSARRIESAFSRENALSIQRNIGLKGQIAPALFWYGTILYTLKRDSRDATHVENLESALYPITGTGTLAGTSGQIMPAKRALSGFTEERSTALLVLK